MTAAIPQHPKSVEVPERKFTVVSPKCVWGKPGDTVSLAVSDAQANALISAGTLKAYVAPPLPPAVPAPPATPTVETAADEERA